MLIEAQPFLKVLAAIITRLNSDPRMEKAVAVEDNAVRSAAGRPINPDECLCGSPVALHNGGDSMIESTSASIQEECDANRHLCPCIQR